MITGLDHTGLAAHDLGLACDTFARLGFSLSPRETLMKLGPQETPVKAGADNHVFMLERGYQELIGITDPSANHPLTPRLLRYQGIHIVLLATDDARASRDQMAARGVNVSECATWSREVAGIGTARFRFFFVFDAPECILGVVEHLTPNIIRPKGITLRHPNGVWALNGCTLLIENVLESSGRYGRILGMPPAETFEFADGSWLKLATSDSLRSRYPGASLPAAPAAAGVEYSTTHLDAITAAGFPIHQSGNGCWIEPQSACGAILSFVIRP